MGEATEEHTIRVVGKYPFRIFPSPSLSANYETTWGHKLSLDFSVWAWSKARYSILVNDLPLIRLTTDRIFFPRHRWVMQSDEQVGEWWGMGLLLRRALCLRTHDAVYRLKGQDVSLEHFTLELEDGAAIGEATVTFSIWLEIPTVALTFSPSTEKWIAVFFATELWLHHFWAMSGPSD